MSLLVWRTLPLRRVVRIIGGGTPASNKEFWDGEIPFATPKDLRPINGGTLRDTARSITQAGLDQGSALAPVGSVLLSVRAPIGYVVAIEAPAAFSQGCKALLPDESQLNSAFLLYALQACGAKFEATANRTTFMELSATGIAETEISLPDLVTQARIVRFLDEETAKIDHLIEKQEILNATAQLRLSEWRERAFWGNSAANPFEFPPDGWTKIPNRHLFKHVDTRSESGEEEMLSVSHITGVTPRSMKNVNMFEAESTVGYKLVEPGQLVTNTMWAWMGALGVSNYDGIVSPAYDVYSFRDISVICPEFIDVAYRTSTYASLMKANSRGIWESRLRLYPEIFLRLPALIPPRDVQDRIIGENKDRTKSTDELVDKGQHLITLLRERRSALITAAVTGQIEV